MSTPVKDFNSDRKKLKAAEADVKSTFRKTLTFDCVDDNKRVRISGSSRVLAKFDGLTEEEIGNLTLRELFDSMKECNVVAGTRPSGFVHDLENKNYGKDTTNMTEDEFVAYYSMPNVIWPKLKMSIDSPFFTQEIARESVQLYTQWLGYGKGGNRCFSGNRPRWWPANVPYADGSKFTAAECDLLMRALLNTFNIPENHHENQVGYKRRRTQSANEIPMLDILDDNLP